MRRSILLLELELIKIKDQMGQCIPDGCKAKCGNDRCELLRDYNQISKDIQTLYKGK